MPRKTPQKKKPAATIELIVRRGAQRRFEKLKAKTAALPVKVSWDRRQADRRTASNTIDADRRKTDRREKSPFTWEIGDFVVVEKTRRRKKP
jgi:hypothetical protein